MLTALGLAMVLVTPQDAPKLSRYSDERLGLEFDYPSSWTQIRRGRNAPKFQWKLASGGSAELDLNRISFHRAKELWQVIQLRNSEVLKREVVRQFEQDVLAVPMLITETQWDDKGTPQTAWSGLYYTRTPLKLLFRLSGPRDSFENVRVDFQAVLETLRTIDGAKLLPDDESLPVIVPRKAPPPISRPSIISGAPTQVNSKFGPVEVKLDVSTKPITLRLPQGWEGEATEGGKVRLKHPELPAPLVVEFRSLLDSESPLAALFRQSSTVLEEFDRIERREDTNERLNAAGCRITSVYRTGTGKSGPQSVFEFVGVQNGFYFIGSSRLASAEGPLAERRLIQGLLDAVGIQSRAG